MHVNETIAEAEHLVTLQETIRETAHTVYGITERLVDAVPDENRNPVVDNFVNFAYEDLLKADKINEMSRNLLTLGAYPSYQPVKQFWSRLEKRSDEQKDRLDHHLRLVCLGDSGELLPRRNAAEAVIDGFLKIYWSRNILFFGLDRSDHTGRLNDGEVRVLEGIIELSLEYVETVAGVVRSSTRVAPG